MNRQNNKPIVSDPSVLSPLYIPHNEIFMILQIFLQLSSAENDPKIYPGTIMNFTPHVVFKQPEESDCKGKPSGTKPFVMKE